FMRTLLARAWDAGCRTLIFTVDLPTPGPRWRDIRSGMSASPGLIARIARALDGASCPQWLSSVYLRGRPHAFGNLSALFAGGADFAASWEWIRTNFDVSVSWRDIDFVRENWRG